MVWNFMEWLQNEVAITAFRVLGKKPKVTHIPDFVRIGILKMIRTFTVSKKYGPIEFFLTVKLTGHKQDNPHILAHQTSTRHPCRPLALAQYYP